MAPQKATTELTNRQIPRALSRKQLMRAQRRAKRRALPEKKEEAGAYPCVRLSAWLAPEKAHDPDTPGGMKRVLDEG